MEGSSQKLRRNHAVYEFPFLAPVDLAVHDATRLAASTEALNTP
jgi:hypothetical protein